LAKFKNLLLPFPKKRVPVDALVNPRPPASILVSVKACPADATITDDTVPARYTLSEAADVTEPVDVQFIPYKKGSNPFRVITGDNSRFAIESFFQIFPEAPDMLPQFVLVVFQVCVPWINMFDWAFVN